MTNRRKIEESFINSLVPLLEGEGFYLKNKVLSGDRYVEFFKKQENVEYIWNLAFLKYGKVSVFFKIFFDETTTLLKIHDPERIIPSPAIFSVKILTLLNPENKDDYFNNGFPVESPYSEELMNGENIESAAKGIFIELFLKPVPNLISRLASLDKADTLLNGEKTIDFKSNSFKWLIYCPDKIYQLTSSLLVAKVLNRPNLPEIAKIYLVYISKYKPGQRKDIDFINDLMVNLFAKT